MKKENIKKETEVILKRETTKEELEALISFLNLKAKNEKYKLKKEIEKLEENIKKEIDKITLNFNKKMEEKEEKFLKNMIKKSLKILNIKNENEEEKEDEETGVHKNYYESLYEEQNKTIFDR